MPVDRFTSHIAQLKLCLGIVRIPWVIIFLEARLLNKHNAVRQSYVRYFYLNTKLPERKQKLLQFVGRLHFQQINYKKNDLPINRFSPLIDADDDSVHENDKYINVDRDTYKCWRYDLLAWNKPITVQRKSWCNQKSTYEILLTNWIHF